MQQKHVPRAAVEQLERRLATEQRRLADIMSLECKTCGKTFGLHHWGHHGPGPFDGLVCPTPEAQAKLAALDADRYGLTEP